MLIVLGSGMAALIGVFLVATHFSMLLWWSDNSLYVSATAIFVAVAIAIEKRRVAIGIIILLVGSILAVGNHLFLQYVHLYGG